ncbi:MULTISPECIES: hypothetical protein [unclassified Spirosoma]|uniref:hypothetical protein n=1 Tax=unclassified Spirosoma TaxID=2621999 RepID=UPI000968B419|nr:MULTISPECIES: hypothetical protein [unclassified Spirosoma]MBN8823451.1 hypothetical protein [Spirosoma sp.]OJW72022.1 MAG: hypothetical protein BGO59_16990 [Spirosoma sp. 48-14]
MICTRFCAWLFAVALLGGLVGCSSSADQLDSQISDALEDNTLDVEEADALRVFIGQESKALGKDKKTSILITPDGKLDESALVAYIKRNRTYRKLVKEGKNPTLNLSGGAVAGKPLRLKLYLEASGSMFPYDAPGGNGLFKRTLNDVLTEFDAVNPNQGKLFVVNTEVNDLGLSLSQFFKEKDIFTVAKTKGKTTSTDFEKIFSDILQNTSGDDLSILVSDLIYSDPSLTGMSAQKTLDAASSLLSTVFNPYANTHSMLVIKLKADFDGTYYSWNNAKKKYTGERPYYLCLIGRNEAMQRLYQDQTYQTIRQFNELPGYQDSWFFGRDTKAVTPFYSVLVNDPARKGRFKRSDEEVRNHDKAVHALTDVQPDVADKSLTIPVAVDLSALRVPASLLTNASQYDVSGKDNFRVTSVQTYAGANGTTHKLLLTTDKPARGKRTVTIRLRREFPPRWIENTNTTNDASPDASSTFGIQNLLQGVERAYNPNNQTDYFTLTINLE